MKVAVEESVLQQLKDYGNGRPTVEVCGALLGQKSEDEGLWKINEFIPITNVTNRALEAVHYIPDPTEWFQAIRQTRLVKSSADKDFMGVFHTHPNNLPIPSETDHREAGYKGIYIIFSPKFNSLGFYYYDGNEDRKIWTNVEENTGIVNVK
jgi:proteasome lid subunit RPN8/RPN11